MGMLFRTIIKGQQRNARRAEQFTGSYLDAQWTKKFILGYLLQHYRPSETPSQSVSSSIGDVVLPLQQHFSEDWKLAAKPLDATSTLNILKLIGRYATGQTALSLESLSLLNSVLAPLGHGDLEDPSNAKRLLEMVGFLTPGDNLRRLVFRGELHFADSAASMLGEHTDPIDPYDQLRETIDEPIYAIDSASTSEVDDAIGVHRDASGAEYFTVYVSDATVHCPFDSQLERLTARTLTTTNYLPEDVFFMLPKPIVEAATLREDRPCRTFNISFRVHEQTGELHEYKVTLGWAKQLRRITYDAVQELYNNHSPERTPQCPSWVGPEHIEKLHRIHHIARIRLQKRLAASKNKLESNLPDPLIQVRGTEVISVKDQILSTKDARIAVAELMIAANEVCSRIAQDAKLAIPYRGTRLLSRDHVVAKEFSEPVGVETLRAADRSSTTAQYFAQAMFRNIAALSGVTRAVYFHEPIFHAGLETTNYAHSTSPLRRYADMLVHHQLKVHFALRSGRRFEEAIPEYQMASLCSMMSAKQEQAAVLQDASARYWLLTYISCNLLENGKNPKRILKCLVGCTRDVRCAPTYVRSWGGGSVGGAFVSDIYIPELQMTHVLFHNCEAARVGTTLDCVVRRVDANLNILELDIVLVTPFEASTEDIMRLAMIPAADS